MAGKGQLLRFILGAILVATFLFGLMTTPGLLSDTDSTASRPPMAREARQ